MADFLEVCNMKESCLPVGFTFSFPCVQHSINSASLIAWTKGFQCEGAEGEDCVRLLEEAIERRGDLKCKIVAIVNDTVGTLMSCAFNEPDCKIGLIVGTGSNACYVEKKSNIELGGEKDGDMIVNMEWGACGDDGALDEFRNEYDDYIDEASLNLGKQKFEKMISGMYLGEIVRLCLCKLVDQNVIFHGLRPEVLFQPGSFKSSFVSQIESSAIEDGMVAVQNILASLDIDRARGADCAVVTRVCQAVSNRAAHLCAAGIAAVARKVKQNHPEDDQLVMICGVDGTLYKKHPTFSKKMNNKVQQLVMDHGIDVQFQLSYDGSGKGAALVACLASS
jgi:hexokinase